MGTVKTTLRRKCAVLSAYISKEQRLEINEYAPLKSEKEQQKKSGWKDTKLRAEINEMEQKDNGED